MKTYKWEQIKLNACRALSEQLTWDEGIWGIIMGIEQQITGEKHKNWRENAKAMREKAWEAIENWDIRKAGKLIKLFPSIVSKKYHGQIPVCDMNEKGDWCLFFS